MLMKNEKNQLSFLIRYSLIIILLIYLIIPIHSRRARCFIIPDNNSGVSGVIHFIQDSEKSPLKIEGKVYGAKSGKHGFHVHEKGTIEGGCANSGNHFNPSNNLHGNVTGTIRHAGDMGNVYSDGKVIDINIETANMTLFGEEDIIGRTCVLHEKEDDLGLKDDEASKLNGNSGLRIACGVVQCFDPIYNMIFGICVYGLGISLALYYFFYYKTKNKTFEETKNLAEAEVKNF